MAKKLLSAFFILLAIATGGLFLYSAFSKIETLESFETFQFTIVEYLHLPWIPAALLAGVMIGIEFALGALLILHLFGKRNWVIKAALGLIIVLSLYLVYLWIIAGDNINCGCFGDAIWMSPSTSLIKNAVIALALLLLIRFHRGFNFRHNIIVILLLSAIGIAIPFFIFPLPDSSPEWLKKDHFKLDMSPLYAPGKTDAPKVDLNKGKHVLAFFSLKCPHCKMAAYKMHLMKVKNTALPFHMVLAGNDTLLPAFFDKSKATNIPYTKLDGDTFIAMVGTSWPVIYWINNGWVDAHTNYVQMDQGEIEKWLQQP